MEACVAQQLIWLDTTLPRNWRRPSIKGQARSARIPALDELVASAFEGRGRNGASSLVRGTLQAPSKAPAYKKRCDRSQRRGAAHSITSSARRGSMAGRLSQPDHDVSGAFRHMFKAETLDTSSKVGAQNAVAPPPAGAAESGLVSVAVGRDRHFDIGRSRPGSRGGEGHSDMAGRGQCCAAIIRLRTLDCEKSPASARDVGAAATSGDRM
jgi:hypothetical protein